jgi:CCR4-NOT transcription complex subunit 6
VAWPNLGHGFIQDNVALIAVLEALEAPQAEGSGSSSRRPLICIANTHIHANPELNDVKLWQVR